MTNEIKILLTKFLIGSSTPEEKKALESWVAESQENKNFFHDIQSVWLLSGYNSSGSNISYKKVWARIEHKIHQLEKEQEKIVFKPENNFRRALAIAAMFILALCLGGLAMYFLNTNGVFMEQNTIAQQQPINDTVVFHAPKGSKSNLVLPDGSKMWLNSNSTVKYITGFNNGKREIFLSGEAFFDINKTNDQKLFYVHTSDIHVKVLGTQFNVKSYPEEGTIETTLEEGKVDIEKKVNEKIIKLLSLEPKQQATFVKKDGKIYLKKIKEELEKINAVTTPIKRKEQIIIDEKVDTELYTSWKDGHLKFVSERFENIAVQFERWYDVTINIENEELKDIVFTANYKNESIEKALEALQTAHSFDYQYDLKKNVITIK